jgi:TPR repeat protein
MNKFLLNDIIMISISSLIAFFLAFGAYKAKTSIAKFIGIFFIISFAIFDLYLWSETDMVVAEHTVCYFRPESESCKNAKSKKISTLRIYELAATADRMKDYSSARTLYKQACQDGEARACTDLGYLWDYGHGGNKNERLAREYYQQGCNAGNSLGCTNLGFSLDNGIGGLTDHILARKLHERACEGGNALGCTNLGVSWDKGNGGAQDYAKARIFYSRGCNFGDPLGCNNLGAMWFSGNGGGKDIRIASEFYSRACSAGEQRGCLNLQGLQSN